MQLPPTVSGVCVTPKMAVPVFKTSKFPDMEMPVGNNKLPDKPEQSIVSPPNA